MKNENRKRDRAFQLEAKDVDDEGFSVSLIPETQERTTLGTAAVGARVNLEVDVMAKYAEKLLAGRLEDTE